MPVNYAIQGKYVTLELVGKYLPDDVIKAFERAMSDPKCPNPAALMVDVRRSETLATTPVPEIRRVAEYIGPFAARVGGRVAVVASSDVHFGLSRLGSVYTEGVGVDAQVFRDVESAAAWLGGE
jgi:hypothetical protein